MHLRPLALTLACAALLPQPAAAFCGFYVAGAEQPLYNDATMVVLLREGTHTVLSMRNDYRGPPENFAMVVPVPEVLSEHDVQTLDARVFDRVDQLASPRLVEYWEQDPCGSGDLTGDQIGTSFGIGGLGLNGTGRGGGGGVTVEAEFAVGEYEVVILSAQDSNGLDTWLRNNDYHIPEGAEAALRPYVEAGTKFFVAKVDVSKVTFVDGRAVLSPLRIHYESEQFSLPVRLGMLNSSGTQDLIVHILADDQRYELANYPNVTVPTNLDLQDDVRSRFSEMYAALFDATLERNPGAVVTEYSWQASGCDPCPGGMSGLSSVDLATLGEGGPWERPAQDPALVTYRVSASTPNVQGELSTELIRRVTRRHLNELRFCQQSNPGSSESFTVNVDYTVAPTGAVQNASAIGGSEALSTCFTDAFRRWTFPEPAGGGGVQVRQPILIRAVEAQGNGFRFGMSRSPKVLTRLHYRYREGGLGEDLVFRAAPPIVGGRELMSDEGTLSQSASESTTNNFQARYAIRHEWTGPIECDEPVRGRWGPPPSEPGEEDPFNALPSLLGAAAPSLTSARNLAQAPRGNLVLAAHLVSPVAALGLDDAALENAAQQDPGHQNSAHTTSTEAQGGESPGTRAASPVESSGCACQLSSSNTAPSAWLALGLAVLFFRRRQRRR